MPRATERLYVGGAAVAALLIVLVGWFLLISPQRDETASIQSQVADSQLQNDTLQARINQLGTQKKDWQGYVDALTRTRRALPARSDMSTFLRSLQAIATDSSAKVTSVSVGDATALTPAPVAVAPASSSASSSAAPSPDAAAGAATSGVFTIPITASVTGTPRALNAFLTKLQADQPRAVLITAVTRGSDAGAEASGSVTSLQLTMGAFVAPEPSTPSGTAGGD